MGWTGFRIEVPIGMIFKKMKCYCCGTKLVKEKLSNIYIKKENGYSPDVYFRASHYPIGMDKLKRVVYIYRCPNCKQTFTYDEQKMINKIQRKKKKIILEKEDFYL